MLMFAMTTDFTGFCSYDRLYRLEIAFACGLWF
jgi:hypothetical protein